MKLIVGSTALEYFGMSRRKAVDLDIWCDDTTQVFPAGVDYQFMPTEILELVECDGYIATPNSIYTIKCSHLEYDLFFTKHKLDILFLKSKGCKLIPELYSALKKYWKEKHGRKDFLSLNQNKSDFFTDNVTYIYLHDDLHQLVAYPNEPVYNKCLKEGHEVLIDKDKFFLMSFEDKVRMFREEIAVIACERWVLNPYWKGKISWYRAHMFSVQKTITTLTKGFASEFLVMNIEHFVKPEFSYYKHILETLGDSL